MRNRNNYLKVDIKKTPEQIAIARQLGSRNKSESMAAAEAIAAVVSRPLLDVIQQAPVFSNFFAPPDLWSRRGSHNPAEPAL